MVVDRPPRPSLPYPSGSAKRIGKPALWGWSVGRRASADSHWDEGEAQVGSGLGTQGPGPRTPDGSFHGAAEAGGLGPHGAQPP